MTGQTAPDQGMTFWDHLDELRKTLLVVIAVVAALTLVMFSFKNELFAIVLAPSQSDFVLYRLLCSLATQSGLGVLCPDSFETSLINTELTGQFMIHIKMAFYAALVVGMPFVLWRVFAFVAPALYAAERRNVSIAMLAGQVLFIMGVLLNYFLIFPLSFRFLVLYEVDASVQNLISLSSYVDTLSLLTLMMGILFEIPLVCIMLVKLGVVDSAMLSKYRRHAVLGILVVSAIITPTTDIFTLVLVSLPIYILYELSVWAVRVIAKKSAPQAAETPTDNAPIN